MRTRVLFGSLVLSLLAACAPALPPPPAGEPVAPPGAESPPRAATATPPQTATLPASAGNGGAALAAQNSAAPGPLQVAGETAPVPLPPALVALRNQGLAAMDAGRFGEARDAFAAVLREVPGDVATAGLLEAADKALRASQGRAAADLSRLTPRVLAKPPFEAFTGKGVPIAERRPLRLVKRSEKRNAITDDELWLKNNGLPLPGLDVPRGGRAGALPESIPTKYGTQKLVGGMTSAEGTVLLFGPDFSGGRYVVLLDPSGKATQVFDFAAFTWAPRIVPGEERFTDQTVHWAEVHEGVLYAATGHMTYAKSSGGKNSFISAIDVSSGELLWQSAPLVSNAANFVVVGAHIVCGYGFTAEPDFLFVLDRATGKTETRLPVASGPSFLIPKGNQLFVRTYDMDYVYAIE
jgi:hypothetical protein